MALKKKIDKEAYEKLSKDLKEMYTAKDEHYLLDLEDDPAAELQRAKAREAADNKALRAELAAAKKKLADLEAASTEDGDDVDKEKGGDKADKRRANDIAKLQKDFDARMKALETSKSKEVEDSRAEIAKRDARLKKSMIDSAANTLATKISTAPALFGRTVADRLDVDFSDPESPVLVVLGKDGKASNMTMEQLSKELVANKDYASIIIGNKASGSGAPREPKPSTPSGAGATGEKAPDLSKMKPKDLAAIIREKKERAAAT